MKYALTMHMNISISTAHSHKMETSQMETIPYMETFLIYQTAYYRKPGWAEANFLWGGPTK